MRPFVLDSVRDTAVALEIAGREGAPSAVLGSVQFLAGGTTLIDLMKLDVMRPTRVIDINALAAGPLGRIDVNSNGVRLGALVRMADAAYHPVINRDFPAITQSLNLAASQQIRNMASLAGNVLQRTRCPYFRDVSYDECNKRNPGSGCAAQDGFNRSHAILGTSDQCIATYPGDFAQALIALDATVEISGQSGTHRVPFSALHRLPEDGPEIETLLNPGEIITAFFVPAGPWTKRSVFVKIRDRESYEFALASAAVALDLTDGRVRDVRIALGGVATIPWRASAAEAVLKNKIIDDTTIRAAAEAAFAGARSFEHNAFKVELGKRTLMRALDRAATMEI
jgi:xanthine dehydrogenase YagS FAD-binding subunit